MYPTYNRISTKIVPTMGFVNGRRFKISIFMLREFYKIVTQLNYSYQFPVR